MELRARVVDENGLGVAGAQMEVRGPTGELLTAYTDDAARATLRFAAAGEYRITLSKPGFFTLTEQRLPLSVGMNEITLTLNHEFEVHEKVEVASPGHRVETQETGQKATLVAREIRDIPVSSSHDLLNSLQALPGVLRDRLGQVHVAGARSGQTQYLLDGFEIGDPATGELTARVNVDGVRAVEMQTGMMDAQFHHAGAGVLALDTVAGDDHWRFGATNFIPDLDFERGVHIGNWYPRYTFSGPLRRGRAWFSEAASVQRVFHLFKDLPPGQDQFAEWAGDNLLRLQLNLTPGHVVQGSFLFNRLGVGSAGLGPLVPFSVTTDFDARRYFASAKDQLWLYGTLVEFGAAFDHGGISNLPQGTQPYVLTPTGPRGNFYEELHRNQRRWQGFLRAVWPSRQWHGPHEIAAGIHAAAISLSQQATRGAIEIVRADNTLLQRTTFSGAARFALHDTQIGAYVQDSWRAKPWLLLQYGVRMDYDRRIGQAVPAPRVAANVLPWGDDRAKLGVGWGIYPQAMDLTLLGQPLDQQRTDTYFDATGTTAILGPASSRFVLLTANPSGPAPIQSGPAQELRQPRFRSASVTWEEKLGARTLAMIHFLDRRQREGLVYEFQPAAPPGGILPLGNRRRDTYRAVEISLRRSFGEKAELFGSYTRSQAETNEVINQFLSAVQFRGQEPGPLAWDAPNRLLVWGWAPLPIWKLLFSYFFEYRTGFPFSVVDEHRQLTGPLNRMRFPDFARLNVAVEKRFKMRKHEWAARLAMINVTRHRNPDSVVNNTDAPNFLTFSGGQGRALTARIRLLGKK